jgi:hypothetical protein
MAVYSTLNISGVIKEDLSERFYRKEKDFKNKYLFWE